MEAKAQKIKELTGFDFYFLEEDKKEILDWDDKLAEKVWQEIKIKVMCFHASGLSCSVCPFCQYYEFLYWSEPYFFRCEKCGYARRHGDCFQVNSDYHKIMKKKSYVKTMTNEWYKKVIEEIEEAIT